MIRIIDGDIITTAPKTAKCDCLVVRRELVEIGFWGREELTVRSQRLGEIVEPGNLSIATYSLMPRPRHQGIINGELIKMANIQTGIGPEDWDKVFRDE